MGRAHGLHWDPVRSHLLFMRSLFLIVLLANLALLAFGQGFFGTPPSEEGREHRMLSERNQQAVVLGEPRAATQSAAR